MPPSPPDIGSFSDSDANLTHAGPPSRARDVSPSKRIRPDEKMVADAVKSLDTAGTEQFGKQLGASIHDGPAEC